MSRRSPQSRPPTSCVRSPRLAGRTPRPDPRPDPLDLAEDDLEDGWSDRALFQVIEGLMPGARAVLRRIIDLGDIASYDGIQQHFATHPTNPIPCSRIRGTLTRK
ncbi:hypothetical protein [Streptomyces olivochromogenes]|uniref:Uncharacterized protein n=1 Tax=Streptomyces olivochromogenes TaxID=1963 RepID=A0A250VQJ9_STROL|nr:hypothetical protein [Streptomyces olivochromogenes]KUN39427.1 hypothetical protein AQJ27_42950 [Streptomyces olivochromogenes]GAX56425.1 hypothetical protein SO3561_07992 [Streptomyces olivochromogenes]